MERKLVGLLGTTAKHVLNAFLRAIRAVVVTGIIVAVIVAAFTEGIGAYLTHSFPPTGATHLAAAALAIAFGYAAAITVAIEEMLRALIKTIELVVDESEKLAVAAVKEAEVVAGAAAHEAGVLGHAAVGDAESLGRGAAGLVSGIVGGIAHGASSVEHGVASALPGHHNADGN